MRSFPSERSAAGKWRAGFMTLCDFGKEKRVHRRPGQSTRKETLRWSRFYSHGPLLGILTKQFLDFPLHLTDLHRQFAHLREIVAVGLQHQLFVVLF